MRLSFLVGLGATAGCSSPPPPVSAPVAPPARPAPIVPPQTHHTIAATTRGNLEADFGFEGSPPGQPPLRWTAQPAGTIVVDSTIVHSGHGAVKLVRTATTLAQFSSVASRIPIDFSGSTIELHGFLRTADVKDNAGLWLREDGDDGVVQFVNMANAKLHGTTEWTEYSIKLPLDPAAKNLIWGALVVGEGTVWADDFRVLVDGKPIWDAPYVEKAAPPGEQDHDFDHGSGISVAQLSPQQIDNLVVLGKVWGFLKYHHPKVTAGKLRWDYQLLHVLPAILAATDRAGAEAALATWIDSLGAVAPCGPCATLDDHDLALRPELSWVDTLGAELGARLHAIDAARVPDQQFYVSLVPGVLNPQFDHENAYASTSLPDAGFQLLALFRLWNVVEYWSPNRALADQDQLAQLVPTVMLATSAHDYKLAMMAAIAKLHDSHANLWSSLDVRPPEGACELAIDLRFVGKRPIVAEDQARKLEPGDEITAIDGTPVAKLLAQWLPYYAASNEASQLRDIAESMTRGPCGSIALDVDRRGSKQHLTLERTPVLAKPRVHDLPGPAFQLLSPDIAYLKLSSVSAADLPHEVEQAAGTKGWIVDIRNYPSEFVVFALGTLLVDKTTPFVRFTTGDLSNPGAFHWTDDLTLEPGTPHYGGKVVVLVDAMSQSQAEYTTMALRSAPHTVIVGSTTAGADGNISPFSMPGGLATMISGIGVFYPDKKATQRVGIAPDVVVAPTVAGLRAGRDEVLEAGIRAILGRATPAARVQKIVAAARARR